MIINSIMKSWKPALGQLNYYRTFKNFGHKRQPIPLITTLWHGFLTVTFISLGLNWERINAYLFGTQEIVLVEPPKLRASTD